MNLRAQFLRFGLLPCAGLVWVTGCTTVRTGSMVPQDVHISTVHSEKVFVRVENTPVNKNRMDGNGSLVAVGFAKSFADALAQTVATSRLYVLADSPETADVLLEVTIIKGGFAYADEPSASTFLVAKWVLKQRDSGAVICERDITTANTHDAPDYIIGGAVSAGRNSSEGSAAANIKQGIEWLDRKTDKELLYKAKDGKSGGTK